MHNETWRPILGAVFDLSVGARLAGEGVLENAFAGKPGSYKKAA
ncbi:hypothetical protein [Pseudomonas sp. Irchel s3b2]|nr:hypothetical protein [Pseudomonas sp. Irchel s3b2]